jgi:hypothetical protein
MKENLEELVKQSIIKRIIIFIVGSRYLPGKRYGWLAKKEEKERSNKLPSIIGGKYKIERQLSGTDKKTY